MLQRLPLPGQHMFPFMFIMSLWGHGSLKLLDANMSNIVHQVMGTSEHGKTRVLLAGYSFVEMPNLLRSSNDHPRTNVLVWQARSYVVWR